MRTILDLLLALTLLVILLAATGLALLRIAVRRMRRRRGLAGVIVESLGALLAAAPYRRGVGGKSGHASRFRAPAEMLVAGFAVPPVWAESYFPGRGREVALLRRDLRRDVAATRRVIVAAGRGGRPVQELNRGFAELSAQAQVLDLDLQVIAAEPEAKARRLLLATPAERVGMIHRACAEVRGALLSGGSAAGEPGLRRIIGDLEDEIAGVVLQAQAYRDLSARHS
jgi:hypothetical protein